MATVPGRGFAVGPMRTVQPSRRTRSGASLRPGSHGQTLIRTRSAGRADATVHRGRSTNGTSCRSTASRPVYDARHWSVDGSTVIGAVVQVAAAAAASPGFGSGERSTLCRLEPGVRMRSARRSMVIGLVHVSASRTMRPATALATVYLLRHGSRVQSPKHRRRTSLPRPTRVRGAAVAGWHRAGRVDGRRSISSRL